MSKAQLDTLFTLFDQAYKAVADSCKNRRGLRMSIPLAPEDEDQVIIRALEEARSTILSQAEELRRLQEQTKGAATHEKLLQLLARCQGANVARQSPHNLTNPNGYVIWFGGPFSYEHAELGETLTMALNAALATSAGTEKGKQQ